MSDPFLSPAEAAARLGVSPKALRLYEQRHLVSPLRTEAGWRTYGPAQMERAGDIVALRALGLSLAQIAEVFAGDASALEPALAHHQLSLETQAGALAAKATQVRQLRAELAQGRAPNLRQLQAVATVSRGAVVGFELPWPWGGERFELVDIPAIAFIVGPLGSGKTQLARRIAADLPDAVFLGLDRAEAPVVDQAMRARLDAPLRWLIDDGTTPSDALLSLLAVLECSSGAVVVDMVEQGLDHATQEALAAHLRRGPDRPPLFLMTRSSAILDLAAVGPGERIILCPANHSPPFVVIPLPGQPGYEAVATCLATPDVRARTAGVVATRSYVA